MSKKLLVIVLLLVACVMIHPFVKEGLGVKPSMLSENLPETFYKWKGRSLAVSGKELAILAKDTDFARKLYYVEGDNSYPGVTASIVFSGKDINNSIHRPERCLRAQGWNFENESYTTVDVEIDGQQVTIPLKEIVTTKPVYRNIDSVEVPLLNEKGEHVVTRNIQYYTFVGYKDIVAGHYERTWHDSIEGRILGGYTQRWAYATFSMTVTQAYIDQGVMDGDGYNDNESRSELKQFIQEFLKKTIKKN
ncbi:MAG: exosortase-associated EpsI family protein [Akkermansiaceae bacterium]